MYNKIWVFFFTIKHMLGKWKFCIFKKFWASEMAFFLVHFCLINNKNKKWNLAPFFGPLKAFQPKLYSHFNAFTPKNGNIYNFASVPHFDPNFTFWFVDMLFLFIPFWQDLNNISAIFSSLFITQCPIDLVMMPPVHLFIDRTYFRIQEKHLICLKRAT